ncbi:MAG: cupin domain-containing protein [Pseudomonadota bacterium]
MLINADFSKRIVIRPQDQVWRPSPMAGVDRMMLDRIGDEVARATSIVRYAPSSHFSAHVHGGGEEFLVLSGSFHDDAGDYPEGQYVRNPIGTSHAPWSGPDGTVIFVKLHQFDKDDTRQFDVDTQSGRWSEAGASEPASLPLHKFGSEEVALHRWPSGYGPEAASHPGGLEILVLDGSLHDSEGDYPTGTWMRLPPGSSSKFSSGEDGVRFYAKSGHLSAEMASGEGAASP